MNPFGETSNEAAQEKREEESLKDSSRWRESTREPAKPLTDPQIVRDFLMGDHCLYGGTGWWKYEFCYGMLLKNEYLMVKNLEFKRKSNQNINKISLECF